VRWWNGRLRPTFGVYFAPSYRPRSSPKEDAAQKLAVKDGNRRKALEDAVNRLFAAKKIKVENYGRPSRPYNKIVEPETYC